MICYPEKLVSEAIGIFSARYSMHQKVYTHKAVKQVEFMVGALYIYLSHYFIDCKL